MNDAVKLPSVDWFWSKVDVRGPDECWNWKRGIKSKDSPYGRFYFCSQPFPAHRFALLLASGPPSALTDMACHSCDNPTCCNPAHLWWGSAHDNARDCAVKGRKVRPDARKMDRAELLRLREAGWSYSMLADHFKVHASSVGRTLKLFGKSGAISSNGAEFKKAKAAALRSIGDTHDD